MAEGNNKPLQHHDLDRKSDETLHQEARAHLGKVPALQLVAELLHKLRSLELPWWTPEDGRACWSATARMGWFKERADLRQQITTSLTGFHANAARKTTLELQAKMIDAVIDQGDVTPAAFDDAFAPEDLVVYGPAAEFWRQFRARAVWDDPRTGQLLGWLIQALIADKSSLERGDACRGAADPPSTEVLSRRPILSALDVRAAIGGALWQRRIPLELRAAIDDARIQQERSRSGQPFLARHELSIVTPELLAEHIPSSELALVLDAAEQAMGFSKPAVLVGAAVEAAGEQPAVTAFAGGALALIPPTEPSSEADVEWVPAPPIGATPELAPAYEGWVARSSDGPKSPAPEPPPPPPIKVTAAFYAPTRGTSRPPPPPPNAKPRVAR